MTLERILEILDYLHDEKMLEARDRKEKGLDFDDEMTAARTISWVRTRIRWNWGRPDKEPLKGIKRVYHEIKEGHI